MADAKAKVNFFFQTSGPNPNSGWTETFYLPAAVGTVSQSLLSQIVASYVPARAALLGAGASMAYARITNIPPNRISYIQYLNAKQGASQFGNPIQPQDYDLASLDLLVRMQDNQGKRRSYWMGGLPDSYTDTGLQQGIQAEFISGNAWMNWVAAIKQNQFQLRSIDTKGPPVVYQANPIAQVVPIYTRKRNRGRPFGQPRGRRLA